MERGPQQPERKSDAVYIFEAIERANNGGEQITDAEARVIASQLHGGQASALYSFASTGAVDYRECHYELAESFASRDSHISEIAYHLETYLWDRNDTGSTDPVEGWNKLWVGGER